MPNGNAMKAPLAAAFTLALAVAVSARAQDDLESRDNRPNHDACGTAPGTGLGKGQSYPFSVLKIEMAIEANSAPPAATTTALVMVADNVLRGKGSLFPPEWVLPKVKEDRDEIPADTEPKTEISGHGTYVTGIVLGGRYDDDALPDDTNLALPSVRRLLFDPIPEPGVKVPVVNSRRKPRFNVRMFPMLKANEQYSGQRISNFVWWLEHRTQVPHVINMSFLHDSASDDNTSAILADLPENFDKTLFVVAAGNSGQPLTGGIGRYPAMAVTHHENLLVIASHNPNFTRSAFSNYGEAYVTLAAPGCGIRSWLPDSAGVALNGTSMAAPIVSFAAALLKSTWQSASAQQLHDRLILSSSFHDELMNCKIDVGGGKSKPVACVKFGSALDIPTAMLYRRDFLEYCEDPDCKSVKPVLGKLAAVPAWVNAGRERDYKGAGETDLSPGSALRRGPKGDLQLLYTQSPGAGQAGTIIAESRMKPSSTEDIDFQVDGQQLDGSTPASHQLLIKAGQLIRLVKAAE